MHPEDIQLALLRQLNDQPSASQRGLAADLGVSVGKINYCLRALVEQGWIKANNFRRSDNKRAYAYMLTPSGIDEKSRLARRFLQRKLVEFEQLRGEIEGLKREADGSLNDNS